MSAEVYDFLLKLAALAPIASIASALIFIASLWIGVLQIRKNRENQLRATAVSLWDKYLDRTMQYPKFAFPERFENSFNYKRQEIDDSAEKYEQYEWFVAALMRTSNEILRSYDKSHERNSMVRRNIRYHKKYITSKGHNFFQDIGHDVRKIVTEIADEQKKELEGEGRKALRSFNGAD